MIDVYKIIKNTKVEGPESRFCIWVQGCSRRCRGCYATQTWEFGVGTKYSVEQLFDMINSEKEIQGLTFLGGEPFEQAKELAQLAAMIKSCGLSVVCFTGYRYEDLQKSANQDFHELLKNIDLLIDGEFDEGKFDLSRPWVGSSNQRYIFLSDRYSYEDIINSRNKFEARINKDGKLELNGMGDFAKISKDLDII